VVDLFEANKRLVLVGHHDHPFTETGQTALETELAQHYGAAHFTRRHIYLRPAGLRQNQARRLPSGIENTTRSRSFLFLAAGVTVADAVGARVPLYVPENGFIGINVPLTGARAGSLSTRTTHPLYMARMQQLLDMLGLDHVIENPFRLLTKGELLVGSANQPLLLSLAKMSVSCSHPEALRWIGKPNGNCGWCYPCLIRRASLHHVGVDDFRDYGLDALNEVDLLKRSSGRGQSLRALATSLRQSEAIEDVVANGRIPNGETRVFYDVYKRGRDELRAWLADAGPGLSRRLGS
jgi:7-cyano-7-deazaguanine synthase in queuosine biosynthesis